MVYVTAYDRNPDGTINWRSVNSTGPIRPTSITRLVEDPKLMNLIQEWMEDYDVILVTSQSQGRGTKYLFAGEGIIAEFEGNGDFDDPPVDDEENEDDW